MARVEDGAAMTSAERLRMQHEHEAAELWMRSSQRRAVIAVMLVAWSGAMGLGVFAMLVLWFSVLASAAGGAVAVAIALSVAIACADTPGRDARRYRNGWGR